MSYRTNSNKKFILTLDINVDSVLYDISIIVTLYNKNNGSRQITRYKSTELKQALEQYNTLTNIIFN